MYISLRGGGIYDFEDPDSSVYEIEDIAHALSMICRWGGHTRFFYSVAQHSCYACQCIRGDEDRFSALMHDTAEAFIGDVVRPIKHHLPGYSILEHKVQREIFNRFNVPKLNEEVHKIDNALLMTEAEQIIPEGLWRQSSDYKELRAQFWAHLPVVIEPWTYAETRTTFLRLFHKWKPK